jgi:hypothetical protein
MSPRMARKRTTDSTKRKGHRRAACGASKSFALRHSTQKPQNSQNKPVFSAGSASSALIVVERQYRIRRCAAPGSGHDIQRRKRRTRRAESIFSAGSVSPALIVVAWSPRYSRRAFLKQSLLEQSGCKSRTTRLAPNRCHQSLSRYDIQRRNRRTRRTNRFLCGFRELCVDRRGAPT